jgi:Domain of unknown function (DUF6268)
MKKIISFVALCLCAVAATSLAEMIVPPSGDAPTGVDYEFQLDGSYVGDSSVERGQRHVNDFNEWNLHGRILILPATPIGILRLGVDYEIYDFDIPSNSQVNNRLQSLALVIGLDTKFSDELLVRFEATPGFYSGDSFEGQDFNIPFILGGTYLYSSTLQFVFGIGVDIESKFPVLPGGGIRWKFAPKWVMNAVLPQPRLEYQLNNNMLLYVGGEIRFKNFRVDDDNVGDASNPGALNNAILSYEEIRTGAGLTWKLGEACKLSVEGGYMPYRQFDYYRTNIRYKSDGGAPYGSLSLHCSF